MLWAVLANLTIIGGIGGPNIGRGDSISTRRAEVALSTNSFRHCRVLLIRQVYRVGVVATFGRCAVSLELCSLVVLVCARVAHRALSDTFSGGITPVEVGTGAVIGVHSAWGRSCRTQGAEVAGATLALNISETC